MYECINIVSVAAGVDFEAQAFLVAALLSLLKLNWFLYCFCEWAAIIYEQLNYSDEPWKQNPLINSVDVPMGPGAACVFSTLYNTIAPTKIGQNGEICFIIKKLMKNIQTFFHQFSLITYDLTFSHWPHLKSDTENDSAMGHWNIT